MRRKLVSCFVAVLFWPTCAGCQEMSKVLPNSTWHEKCGWKAEEYFDDPQVISLCKAIEANDLEEVDRLVAAGADVNAQGEGKMTPLLWAYPDNKLQRFKRLLEHGADPNVVIESDFNTRDVMSPGDSVTHMATATWFPGYFEAVFEHGGDPNLLRTTAIYSKETPLFTLIKGNSPNKKTNVKFLIEKGANLDQKSGTGRTTVHLAVGRRQFDIALMLLEAGAGYQLYLPNSNSKLIHFVVEKENLRETWTRQQNADYQELVKWLEDHGELFEQARADNVRWQSWSLTTGEYQRKMAKEVAERKAREAREKAFAEKADDVDEQ